MIGQEVSHLEDKPNSARQGLNNKNREVNQLTGENSKLENTTVSKEDTEKGVQETRTEVRRVLDKYLMDDRIIYSDDKFTKVEGIQNSSVTTVTYSSEIYDTRFIAKEDSKRNYEDSFRSTIVEVIAGSLYKALLYDRSPTFTLMEVSNKSYPYQLKLKSKLLNNFVTLNQFMYDKTKEMVAELIREKFANENGIEELASYSVTSFDEHPRMMNQSKKRSITLIPHSIIK